MLSSLLRIVLLENAGALNLECRSMPTVMDGNLVKSSSGVVLFRVTVILQSAMILHRQCIPCHVKHAIHAVLFMS